MNGSGTAPQTIPPPSLQCHLFTTRRNYENSPSRRLHVSAATRIMRGAISAAALASSLIFVSTRPGVSPFGVSSAKGRVHGPLGDIQNFLRGGLPDFVRILDCLANLSRSQAGFMCFGNVEFNTRYAIAARCSANCRQFDFAGSQISYADSYQD
jgi:hypothetical protein